MVRVQRRLAAGLVVLAPSHHHWNDIVVHGMTCDQAVQLHQEKLRDCTHAQARVKRHESIYTCVFGPWKSLEQVRQVRFSDRIRISRDHGRVWMRYNATP
jgi:hypothetical protein